MTPSLAVETAAVFAKSACADFAEPAQAGFAVVASGFSRRAVYVPVTADLSALSK